MITRGQWFHFATQRHSLQRQDNRYYDFAHMIPRTSYPGSLETKMEGGTPRRMRLPTESPPHLPSDFPVSPHPPCPLTCCGLQTVGSLASPLVAKKSSRLVRLMIQYLEKTTTRRARALLVLRFSMWSRSLRTPPVGCSSTSRGRRSPGSSWRNGRGPRCSSRVRLEQRETRREGRVSAVMKAHYIVKQMW
jgi:hypothetical protein